MNADIKQRIDFVIEYGEKSTRQLLHDCLKHIESSEASCAAMREFIEKSECGRKCCDGKFYMEFSSDLRTTSTKRLRCEICEAKRNALSTDAGKSLLDRLQAVEKEREHFKNCTLELGEQFAKVKEERDRYREALAKLQRMLPSVGICSDVIKHALQPAQKEQ